MRNASVKLNLTAKDVKNRAILLRGNALKRMIPNNLDNRMEELANEFASVLPFESWDEGVALFIHKLEMRCNDSLRHPETYLRAEIKNKIHQAERESRYTTIVNEEAF